MPSILVHFRPSISHQSPLLWCLGTPTLPFRAVLYLDRNGDQRRPFRNRRNFKGRQNFQGNRQPLRNSLGLNGCPPVPTATLRPTIPVPTTGPTAAMTPTTALDLGTIFLPAEVQRNFHRGDQADRSPQEASARDALAGQTSQPWPASLALSQEGSPTLAINDPTNACMATNVFSRNS